VKLLLVLSLILTAALLVVSFAGAAELAPNELGRVMILEYHKIDYPEARWTRTPENFRRDLATLYAKGYRLIALGDLLDGRIVLPAGTTPIVLTFDDSSPGQFRYIEQNGVLAIDPKSRPVSWGTTWRVPLGNQWLRRSPRQTGFLGAGAGGHLMMESWERSRNGTKAALVAVRMALMSRAVPAHQRRVAGVWIAARRSEPSATSSRPFLSRRT